MKKLMLLAVAAVTAITVSAQSFEDFFSTQKSPEKVTVGVRMGLNINGMRNNIDNHVVSAAFGYLPYKLNVHNKAGINLGVNVDIPILRNLWINTGVYYSSTGAKMKFTQNFFEDYDGILTEYSANLTMHNVRVPVQASYRYTFNDKYQIQVNLGPYFAYGFGGKVSVKNDMNGNSLGKIDLTGNPKVIEPESDESIILGETNINPNKSNYINPFDMGISIGAGVTLLKKYYAGINYDAGLINVNGKRAVALNHYKIKNHVFSINVGYNF